MADPGFERGGAGDAKPGQAIHRPGTARQGVRLAMACLALAGLAACGNTGDLYLPEAGTTGEVVTRPAPTPPAGDSGSANSPQTADSPVVPPNPAPEVTEPEDEKDDAAKPRQ